MKLYTFRGTRGVMWTLREKNEKHRSNQQNIFNYIGHFNFLANYKLA